MGQAKRRGTREERVQQAQAAGRIKHERPVQVNEPLSFAHRSDGEVSMPLDFLALALALSSRGLRLRK